MEVAYENELYVCARCGYCREVCPVKRLIGFERVSPRGKILSHKYSLESGKTPSKELVENWYLCTTCGYCKEVCPTEIDFPEVVKSVRTDLVTRNLGSSEAFVAARKSVQSEGNPLGKLRAERTNWVPADFTPPKKAEYLYFAGCMASYWATETATAIVEVLRKINLNFGILGENEPCCGMISRWGGEKAIAKEMAEKNLEVIRGYGAKTLVTSCPGCYTTFTQDYPNLVGKLGFNVLHISELLTELIKDGKLKFQKEVPMVVTYHDPCHIGRFHRIFEAPREIISAIPGIKLVEMDYSKAEANCCGGPLRTAYADYSVAISRLRVKEAAETGASTLLTFCPLCYINLRRAAREEKLRLRVTDIPMLLAQAL